MNIGRDLFLLGVVLIAIGLVINLFHLTSLPKLPGDVYIKRGSFTFYFPWVTSLIISVILSAIFYFFFRR